MKPDVLCIGSVHWDYIGRSAGIMRLGADVPGLITRLPGGVAMNIAMTLSALGLRPALLTSIGRDVQGEMLAETCVRLGMDVRYAYRPTHLPTDRYMAIEDANGLIAAIADTRSLEAAGAQILHPLSDGSLGSEDQPWTEAVALDGNLTADLLAEIAGSPLFAKADLRLAPASPGKVNRLRALLGHPGLTLYVNLEEANLLTGIASTCAPDAAAALLQHGATRVLVTDGARPCADGRHGAGVISDLPPPVKVSRVTGAGDTFMATHLAAERQGRSRQDALRAALDAAAAYVAGAVGT